MHVQMRRRLAALSVVTAALGGLAAAGQAQAAGPAVWLCRPGLASNPCAPGLSTTRISASGEVLGRVSVPRDPRPKVDCFYVYPTVSGQPGLVASRRIDPEQRSIALYQAARYSQTCRVFAPMYRQITLAGLGRPGEMTPALSALGYGDVRAAWREYLRRDNRGRGVVLIGHSQGSYVLRKLIAEEIDRKPAARERLVSALLLGGNVTVRKGRDVGGDFAHVRACRASRQLGCVIAFSTYNATPPDPSRFGRPRQALGVGSADTSGLEVLCTNPAALAGGSGRITAIFPSAPFAPGTVIGALTTQVGFPMPAASTVWEQADRVFGARCSQAAGARVLLLSGAGKLQALPDASWGLHLADANIALGDLARIVRIQARRYVSAR